MVMSKQVPISDDTVVDTPDEGGLHQIADDLAYARLAIVNAVFVGAAGNDARWVLIDAGIPGMAGRIQHAAAERFGEGRPPVAIVLTHGHFDHVGSLGALLDVWDVPVYAHESELPFLDGTTSYPPPDPTVGGGLMALSSPLFPAGPFNFSKSLYTLPADGSVPGMPEWRWIHTPGHAPGHVSLWRSRDRALVVGDAFITTKQESAYAVATQRPEIHGPPMYFTPDWESAEASVQRLAALEPELVVTGHGRALHGSEVRQALHLLADNFASIAVPKHGRYVDAPSQRT
jgi:glyoxylase-like metal-dependent hydrolase (beta-lactamase superfamily II)